MSASANASVFEGDKRCRRETDLTVTIQLSVYLMWYLRPARWLAQ